MMREAPDRDDVANEQRFEEDFVAGHERDPLCSFERVKRFAPPPVDENRSGRRAVQSRDRAQKRRLAGTVSSENGDELAGRDVRVDALEERPAADGEFDSAKLDHQRLPRCVCGRR